MSALRFIGSALLAAALLDACAPDYSPDKYASNAVQQANKVEQGVIVGVRPVAVTAQGVVGSAAGAAAGGALGSQAGTGIGSTLGAIGGSVVGGLVGSAVEHGSDDTTATEYVVRKTNGDLVSVTQKDEKPLAIGQKVLVIAGNQARIVPDYTVAVDGAGVPAHPGPAGADATAPTATAPTATAPTATAPPPNAPTPNAATSGATTSGTTTSSVPAPGMPTPLAPDKAAAPPQRGAHTDGTTPVVPPPVPVQSEPLTASPPASI